MAVMTRPADGAGGSLVLWAGLAILDAVKPLAEACLAHVAGGSSGSTTGPARGRLAASVSPRPSTPP